MHAVRLVRPRLPWGSWLMVVSDWRLHLWLSATLRGVVPGFLADLVLPSVHGCGVSGRQVDACGSGLYSAWRPSSIEIPSFLCLVFSHAEQSMFCLSFLSVSRLSRQSHVYMILHIRRHLGPRVSYQKIAQNIMVYNVCRYFVYAMATP